MKLSEEEIRSKEKILEDVCDVIKTVWPDAIITVSGLLRLGLVLPESPVEISVAGTGEPDNQISTLADAFLETGHVKSLERITSSHMPSVKVGFKRHKFDIYFDQVDEIPNDDRLTRWIEHYPEFQYVYLVVK